MAAFLANAIQWVSVKQLNGISVAKICFKFKFFLLFSSTEYDNAKAVTAMCEIAMEACQSWFPQPESK